MISLPKYPRTEHILNSKETNTLPIDKIQRLLLPNESVGPPCIVEEKIDGSSVSIGFDSGRPYFFHRNSPAVGPEFDLLKSWVNQIETELYLTLGERYIMYGEWLYHCHTIVYTKLPSYFIEYDIYDKDKDYFLDTYHRRSLIQNIGINSVEYCSLIDNERHPMRMAESCYSEPVLENLDQNYLDHYTVRSGMMEGLYFKMEDEGRVFQRYKFIRKDFIDTVLKSNHWSKRYPPIQNRLVSK